MLDSEACAAPNVVGVSPHYVSKFRSGLSVPKVTRGLKAIWVSVTARPLCVRSPSNINEYLQGSQLLGCQEPRGHLWQVSSKATSL